MWAACIGYVYYSLGDFEETKGWSWRDADTWHFEKPEEAIGVALVAVEGPELKGSCKEAEATGESVAQWQQETPVLWKDCHGQQQLGCGAGWSLGDKLCVLSAVESTLGEPRTAKS